MRARRFQHRSVFPVTASALWDFHLQSDALEVLAPPLSGFRVVDRGAGVENGSVLVAEVGWWVFRSRWTALHFGIEPGRSFTDVALDSPFSYWVHHHRVEAVDVGFSRLTDSVWFVPPRWMPALVGGPLVAAFLRLFFAWRHRATRRWLARQAAPSPGSSWVRRFFAPGGCS
jgi:ligand-binding SRPBCC domain-containing protein